MTAPAQVEDDAWQTFVITHGRRARASDLGAVLQQPVADILRLRATGACSRTGRRKGFAEIFRLWHGRDPGDDEWPPPRRTGRGQYEWQGPEFALLAGLVGRLGNAEIVQILTTRLRQVTGDPDAGRTLASVQVTIQRIGMQTQDLVGGITISAAGREIGSLAMVRQAIAKGTLRARRIGRRWVIPHDSWATWKDSRIRPPDGHLPLATLKRRLAIRSDKLSEYARLGYIPTAIQCNPFGAGGHSTQFGTWYIAGEVERQLIDDRLAGRPMPWHGRPLADNLKATYRLWQARRHRPSCATCAGIWGRQGPPDSFEAYAERYPPLAHGAKRHLTRPWSAGLTMADVAGKAGCSAAHVRRAIENGTLAATRPDGRARITRTDATRWIRRGSPAGDARRSWVSIATAARRYLFTQRELTAFIADKRLRSRTASHGADRGTVYVSRQQCAHLRETIGFTERAAARRAGVSVPAFRAALAGVNWRGTGAIPLTTVQAVIRRLRSRPGYTLGEAADALGRSRDWIGERIRDGTVRPLRRQWNEEHVYLSEPMMRRLRAAPGQPDTVMDTGGDWLGIGAAALEAGVTPTTIVKWAIQDGLDRVRTPAGWRYPRDGIRACARTYWTRCRFRRAARPAWIETALRDQPRLPQEEPAPA